MPGRPRIEHHTPGGAWIGSFGIAYVLSISAAILASITIGVTSIDATAALPAGAGLGLAAIIFVIVVLGRFAVAAGMAAAMGTVGAFVWAMRSLS